MPASRYIFGTVPWYSVLIVLGICAAIAVASCWEKKENLPKDTVIDLCLRMIPLGIIGARAYYVIFAWDTFKNNPVSVLYIWNGGLAIYGGIIGGAAAAVLFARKRKISILRLLDVIVPGVALAQAIGRWGNFFNMEAYGAVMENQALCFFPLAVQILENGTIVWHMATFFYESVWNLTVFAVLMLIARKKHPQGQVLLWYLLLYGAGRMLIEGLRTDSLMTGQLRVSQLLSAVLCVGSAAVLWFRSAGRPEGIEWGAALAGLIPGIFFPAPGDAFPGSLVFWSLSVSLAWGTSAACFRRKQYFWQALLIAASLAGRAGGDLRFPSVLSAYMYTCFAIDANVVLVGMAALRRNSNAGESDQKYGLSDASADAGTVSQKSDDP